MATEVFDLVRTYVHLGDGGGATRIDVSPTFWQEVMAGKRRELGEGRLVAVFRFEGDWTNAEMHPAGDEIVYVLSGAIALVLQEPTGDQTIELTAGTGHLVPRGVWHTARVRAPANVLHVTPGAGTEHGAGACICDECIDLCNEVIERECERESLAGRPASEATTVGLDGRCALCHLPKPSDELLAVPDRGFVCSVCLDAVRAAAASEREK
jgi:mannose-6-phosphate isomerase-like protein (cupin superfamily)